MRFITKKEYENRHSCDLGSVVHVREIHSPKICLEYPTKDKEGVRGTMFDFGGDHLGLRDNVALAAGFQKAFDELKNKVIDSLSISYKPSTSSSKK